MWKEMGLSGARLPGRGQVPAQAGQFLEGRHPYPFRWVLPVVRACAYLRFWFPPPSISFPSEGPLYHNIRCVGISYFSLWVSYRGGKFCAKQILV